MKLLLNDLWAWTRNSPNLLQWRRACSPKVRVRSACSCSNSAVFPYGGQECSHVSQYPSGSRWNGPLRLGVRRIERAGFPPHPSLFMWGSASSSPPPQPRFTHQLSYMIVFMECSSPSASVSIVTGIRERTGRN